MKKLLLPICLAAVIGAEAKVLKIELPVETVTSYKNAPGVELANANCVTCHSIDYTLMQPTKPRDFWKAEVEKMIGKYGAAIPDDQTNALINYFAINYGGDTNVPAPVVAKAQPTTGTIDAKQLAIKSGCFNCHNIKAKVIGPAYKDVAAKYASDPEALKKISEQVTGGGAGKWGQFPMPPFKQFSDAELKALGEWILSLK